MNARQWCLSGITAVLLMGSASNGNAETDAPVMTVPEAIVLDEERAPGEEGTSDEAPAPDEEPERAEEENGSSGFSGMVDGAQSTISRSVVGLSRGIDRFLGTEAAEYEDEDYDSLLRMNLAYLHDARGNNFEMALEGDLSLPGTEDRVDLIFERADPDDPSERDREVRDTENGGVRRYLGVRFLNPLDFMETETSFRIPGQLPMELRSEIRLWRDFEPGVWRLRPRLTVFDARVSGTGHTWDFGLYRPVGENLRFISSTAATWFRRESQHYYDQTLSLIQPLGRRREIVWQIGADAESEPEERLTLYYAQIQWRRVMHRDGLLLVVPPLWRRALEDDFETEFRFYLGVDLLFGHYTVY